MNFGKSDVYYWLQPPKMGVNIGAEQLVLEPAEQLELEPLAAL